MQLPRIICVDYWPSVEPQHIFSSKILSGEQSRPKVGMQNFRLLQLQPSGRAVQRRQYPYIHNIEPPWVLSTPIQERERIKIPAWRCNLLRNRNEIHDKQGECLQKNQTSRYRRNISSSSRRNHLFSLDNYLVRYPYIFFPIQVSLSTQNLSGKNVHKRLHQLHTAHPVPLMSDKAAVLRHMQKAFSKVIKPLQASINKFSASQKSVTTFAIRFTGFSSYHNVNISPNLPGVWQNDCYFRKARGILVIVLERHGWFVAIVLRSPYFS